MLVVGTGGIGSGMFLALHGDRTLGREESRAATLLDRQDAAKLHIVLHYVQRLLGPAATVLPIGMVGDDAAGRDAVERMRAVGMDVSLIGISRRPTLFSVCFQYPNGEGGNITTADSASDEVGPERVRAAWAQAALQPAVRLVVHHGPGVAVALPEVPLAARAELLGLATEAGFRRVAAFVSQEWEQVLRLGLLERVDLLAVNLDEAAALAAAPEDAGAAPGEAGAADVAGAARVVVADVAGAARAVAADVAAADVVAAAVERARTLNDRLQLVVTAGRSGSWAWDGRELTHTPAPAVVAVNTAGAGDAHLAGLIVATARGLTLATANRYAALVSGRSVTSPHTIDPDLTAERIRADAAASGWRLPAQLPA